MHETWFKTHRRREVCSLAVALCAQTYLWPFRDLLLSHFRFRRRTTCSFSTCPCLSAVHVVVHVLQKLPCGFQAFDREVSRCQPFAVALCSERIAFQASLGALGGPKMKSKFAATMTAVHVLATSVLPTLA